MIPSGNHSDWMFPFCYIPRRWTAWESTRFPIRLLGNTPIGPKGPKPIPERGYWHVSWPPYFAFQTRSGWHGRIGVRFDNIDDYYQFPSFKIGHYTSPD